MAYLQSRRYKVVNGKILKNFDGDQKGWFKSKAEAWSDLMEDAKPEVKAAAISSVVSMVGVESKRKPGRPRKVVAK